MKIYYIKNEKECFLYKDDRIVKSKLKKEKKAIYTSLIDYKDIQVFNFRLNSTPDTLFIDAENYIFNELHIDTTKNFVIKLLVKPLDNSYLVNAFLVEENILINKFSNVIDKIRYIDFITLSPFVFSAYYDIKNIKPENDMFLYLGFDSSYIVFFSNKEFLSIKNLDKLSVLAKQLNLSQTELSNLLQEKGLDESKYEDLEIFYKVNQFFSNLFSKVNVIINFTLGSFKVEQINNIYYYFPFEIKDFDKKIDEFFSLFNIKSSALEIKSEYEVFDVLATYFNAKNYQNEEINFTIFKRPPPLYKQDIGKFFIFLSILIIIGTSISIYQYFRFRYLPAKIKEIEHKIYLAKKKNSKLVSDYKDYKQKIYKLDKDILKLESIIEEYYSRLSFLKNKKIDNFIKKYSIIVFGLKKYKLKLDSLKKDKGYYELIINTDFINIPNIAKFLSYLKDNNFNSISIKEIKVANSDKYITQVSFYDR